MKKLIIALVIVVIIAILVILNLRSNRKARTGVYLSEVKKRNIEKIVTASGTIEPKRQVNVSASAIGKITKLAVREGQHVNKGDFILQIDPTQYQSSVDQLEAAIRAAEAALEMEQATLRKSEYDLKRAEELHAKEFLSDEELKSAEISVEINRARVKTAKETLARENATLKTAKHNLREVRITAEMSGIITALNVEEGESAIMGTLNNPGTVLLTIADLSEMEAEIQVDETEVVYIKVGQKAEVKLDAYPDTTFSGTVTEVGNSAIRSLAGVGQESVDFKVVVAIQDSIPNIRPGLSASVDIVVANVENGLGIPIQCLTVRKKSDLEKGRGKTGAVMKADTTSERSEDEDGEEDEEEIEGVFVVVQGEARFRPVQVGIAGESYFHVESGLELGEKVVSGPFDVINDLNDGDAVKIREKFSKAK